MTTFDEREQAFENLFAHDQETLFKAKSQRNVEVARWVAAQCGLADQEVEIYGASVLAAALEGGDAAVLRKLSEDLRAAQVYVSDHQVSSRMDVELAKAQERIVRG